MTRAAHWHDWGNKHAAPLYAKFDVYDYCLRLILFRKGRIVYGLIPGRTLDYCPNWRRVVMAELLMMRNKMREMLDAKKT